MRSHTLRTLSLATAAVLAAVALYIGATAPPAAIRLDGSIPSTQITGGYHIHSSRSDGTGTADEIAAAAARAGLSFIVLTDHGDGTRVPDPPTYRRGVLTIDAVELNTAAGHVVALGLPGATAYPFAGNARDVLEDIHRLDGKAILAHPDSPNPGLRWRGQNLPFDGIEWLNIDSEWRNDNPGQLIVTAARSLVRAPEAIASLFSRPARTFARWDNASRSRAVFGIAALDAHASIAWRDTEEPRRRAAIARPTYESMFRTLAQSVQLDAPLSGDAVDDAARVIGAIAAGQSFSAIRAFADPASLEFTAEHDGGRVRMGSRVVDTGKDTTFHARVPQAPGAGVSLLRDGKSVVSGRGTIQFVARQAPGVYRVEVTLPDLPMPWIVSNPIVISSSAPSEPPGAERPEGDDGVRVSLPMEEAQWSVERDSSSSGIIATDNGALRFTFQLGPGAPSGQYAALAHDVGTDSGVDRIEFVGRASRPMRVSVQVRLPGGGTAQRWRRSVYLDTTPRTISVYLEDFEPADVVTTRRPIVTPLQSLLFVVDTVNTLTGTDGVVWVSEISLRTRRP